MVCYLRISTTLSFCAKPDTRDPCRAARAVYAITVTAQQRELLTAVVENKLIAESAGVASPAATGDAMSLPAENAAVVAGEELKREPGPQQMEPTPEPGSGPAEHELAPVADHVSVTM
jgi:hypothetical protein